MAQKTYTGVLNKRVAFVLSEPPIHTTRTTTPAKVLSLSENETYKTGDANEQTRLDSLVSKGLLREVKEEIT